MRGDPELLTVEEFAKRMKVSRTTVFGWLKSGVLSEGVHYFRIGRILRFCWREGLFFNSQQKQPLEDECQTSQPPLPRSEQDSQRGAASVPGPGLTVGRGAAPAINLDY
ncbi:helix-turn-helix DNA-binding protein, putative [Citrifermentans bemidjiense Bem]|uniref:Helix-turn-helix DNA-binding protein, putative n=1 Tax=Citrifermentans bemidjiense (strain ATCC BAA-1014 / DSM 16622 / JCM 12645 / Bem) TaxID=404380 RepID=B5E8A1_CITBB|nr:helix-turn-helix DNA-binding protein, putative [Citrifermentans bemidjiense Bem]